MASARSSRFAEQLAGKSLSGLRRMHKSETAGAWTAELEGLRVIVRQPRNAETAQRVHDAMLLMAQEAGVPEWVMPSVLASMNGRDVMITEHAPLEFRTEVQVHLSEETRALAALLDFLSAQCDRISKNLLLSADGALRLIDHDESFGSGPVWHDRRSVFLPGGVHGFEGEPETPAWVHALAAQPPAHYGLLPAEASLVQVRARLVVAHGLREADARVQLLEPHMRSQPWWLGETRIELDPQSRVKNPTDMLAHWHLHAESADWCCYFLSKTFEESLRLVRVHDNEWVGETVTLQRRR